MQMGWSSDWNRVTLPLSVLLLLEARPAHGYALLVRLAATGHADVTGGTLYPLLSRMADRGWVEHAWEHAESGPGRKIFSVTSAGVDHLNELVEEWERVRIAMDQLASTRKRGQR